MSPFRKIVITLLLGPITVLALFILYAHWRGGLSAPTTQAQPRPANSTRVSQQPAADLQAKNDAWQKQTDADWYRKQISEGIIKLNDVATRFNDLNQVAAATPRGQLSPLVQQMQTLARESQAVTVHDCLAPAQASLTGIITGSISTYLTFMASGSSPDQFANTIQDKVSTYVVQRDACVTW